jgi:hypothetical protein
MSSKGPGLELLLVILGIALIGIVLLAHGSVSWYEEVSGRSSTPNVPQVLEGEGGMVSMAWVDEGEVTSDSTVRIWIQVENHAQTAIEHLRLLAFHTPGFQKVGPCWKMNLPSCRPDTPKGTDPQGLPGALKSGESSIVYADLRPATWYGSHSASGVLSWQDDKATRARAVVLPAVQIISPGRRFFASAAKSLDLLKDLALPLVLVVFGSYLQNKAKRREEDKADRDKQQTQIRETWAMMLPKVQSFAENHYMPVSASIESFSELVKDKEKSRQALFEFLRLIRRMRHFALSVGGLFFRDREAEILAARTWALFLDRVRSKEVFGREDLERAMSWIATDETYAQFVDKLTGQGSGDLENLNEPLEAFPGGEMFPLLDSESSEEPQRRALLLQKLEAAFEIWGNTEKFKQDIALLELFGRILSYEMNRPYLFWYPEPVKFPLEKLEATLATLGPEHELTESFRAYVKPFQRGAATT